MAFLFFAPKDAFLAFSYFPVDSSKSWSVEAVKTGARAAICFDELAAIARARKRISSGNLTLLANLAHFLDASAASTVR